jgi:hypothetical protein
LVGYLDVIDGHPEAGIGRIEETIRTRVVDHAPGQRATHLRLLLAAFDRADEPVRGLAAADAALLGPSTLIWEAEARRLRARFLAGVGAPADEIDRELGRATKAADRAAAVGPQRTIEATRCQIVPQR